MNKLFTQYTYHQIITV